MTRDGVRPTVTTATTVITAEHHANAQDLGVMVPVQPASALPASMASWVTKLVDSHVATARTHMAGLAVCHPGLQVQAVGFQVWAEDVGEAQLHGLLGVLVTPWFMNLVWRADEGASGWTTLPIGHSRTLNLGAQPLPFTGAHAPTLGAYAACSLISPMFQFADQAAAVATAQAVVDTLVNEALAAQARRQADEEATRNAELAAAARQAQAAPAMPARRGFLFGRDATPTGPQP
jgi:[NiFe] hydrogenase assembly HybE family chaperone